MNLLSYFFERVFLRPQSVKLLDRESSFLLQILGQHFGSHREKFPCEGDQTLEFMFNDFSPVDRLLRKHKALPCLLSVFLIKSGTGYGGDPSLWEPLVQIAQYQIGLRMQRCLLLHTFLLCCTYPSISSQQVLET